MTDWRSTVLVLSIAVCQHAVSKMQAVPAGTANGYAFGIASRLTPVPFSCSRGRVCH
jgi:hypothetical protein